MASASGNSDWFVLKRRVPQYAAAVAASFGGFSLGCALGWSAPATQIIKEEQNFGIFNINLIGAALPVGAALGVIVVPFIIDLIGRKHTMLWLVPPFITAWIMIIVADSSVTLYCLGRLITGACGGMFCVASPMYCAEISEKEIRGKVCVFFQLLLVIGIFYAYCSGFTDNVVTISFICGLAPVAFGIGMIFMPESPLFYMIKGEEEAARNVMRYFRGNDYDIEPELNDFKAITSSSKLDLSVLKRWPVLKTLGVAYGLMAAQQLCGINTVIFYGVSIFEMSGVQMDALVQSVILGVVQVFGCLVSVALIDKLGRKFLMILSEGLMGVCLLAMGAFFAAKDVDPKIVGDIGWLPVTALSIYIGAFCIGAGPIPWAYMGEIFPTKFKGVASSSAAFLNWTLASLVTVSFESVASATSAAAVFFFFCVICLISVVFVACWMVETKGKTFAQIQRDFGTQDVFQDEN